MVARVAARVLLGLTGGGTTAAQIPRVDISLSGDRELQRMLNELTTTRAKAVIRKPLRAAAKRAKKRIVQNLSGSPVAVQSGALRAAFAAARIASAGSRTLIRLGVAMPTQAELGPHASSKYYLPYSVEYGHSRAAARPYIRPAIDEHKTAELRIIGTAIGKGIEAEARRR